MDERPPFRPERQRFGVVTEAALAAVRRTASRLWTVELHDGEEPAKIQITAEMLLTHLDPRWRVAVEEVIAFERRQPDPSPIITDTSEG